MMEYTGSPDLIVAIQDLRLGLRLVADQMVQAEADVRQLDQRLAAILDTIDLVKGEQIRGQSQTLPVSH